MHYGGSQLYHMYSSGIKTQEEAPSEYSGHYLNIQNKTKIVSFQFELLQSFKYFFMLNNCLKRITVLYALFIFIFYYPIKETFLSSHRKH